MNTPRQNQYIEMLYQLVSAYRKGYSVKIYLFGSRAVGKEHRRSDIDIAILPIEPLPANFIADLREKIEESAIPYTVDVVDLSQVDLDFRNNILKKAIEWKD